MKKFILSLSILFSFYGFSDCPSLLDHEIRILASSEEKNLCDFEGKVILAVNVASQCGYTYQYESLQSLYTNYKDKNFVILGFPSNDFFQERAKDEAEVKEFCKTTYGVDFPMFKRSHVTNGGKLRIQGYKANPFYADLIRETGIQPSWNFNKYLISKTGEILHFNQDIEPDSEQLLSIINSLL